MDDDTLVDRLAELERRYRVVDLLMERNKPWRGASQAIADFARSLTDETQEQPESGDVFFEARETIKTLIDEFHNNPAENFKVACTVFAYDAQDAAESMESVGLYATAWYLIDAAALYSRARLEPNPDWEEVGNAMIALALTGWNLLNQ